MNSSNTWVAPIFLALAAWFTWGQHGEVVPIPERVDFDLSELGGGPLRIAMTDPPSIPIGAHEQGCSDCHRLFESDPEKEGDYRQHENVALDHGLNDRCLNCHSTTNRDKLILQGTREIGFDDVVQLCAKCHGPTYRDWERGSHGKTMGAWDVDHPAHYRLGCTECHDPHAPAYDPIVPLPGPSTLRMGERPEHPPHVSPDRISPLMRWLSTEPSSTQGEH